MKRWYIEYMQEWVACSLLNLAGSSKVAHFKSDGGVVYAFKFMKFYDFSRAKDGSQQNGWCHISGTNEKIRCNIIFK